MPAYARYLPKKNTDKALKYGIYRHLPTYEKIIRNLVSFLLHKIIKIQTLSSQIYYLCSILKGR